MQDFSVHCAACSGFDSHPRCPFYRLIPVGFISLFPSGIISGVNKDKSAGTSRDYWKITAQRNNNEFA